MPSRASPRTHWTTGRGLPSVHGDHRDASSRNLGQGIRDRRCSRSGPRQQGVTLAVRPADSHVVEEKAWAVLKRLAFCEPLGPTRGAEWGPADARFLAGCRPSRGHGGRSGSPYGPTTTGSVRSTPASNRPRLRPLPGHSTTSSQWISRLLYSAPPLSTWRFEWITAVPREWVCSCSAAGKTR